MATKKPTAAQIAARKEFARIMKSGGFKANPKARKPAAKPVAKKAAPARKKNPAKKRAKITEDVFEVQMSPDGKKWVPWSRVSYLKMALDIAKRPDTWGPNKYSRVLDKQTGEIYAGRSAAGLVKRNPRGLPAPSVSHTAKVYLLEMSRDGRVWNVEHAFASPHFATSKAHAMAADAPRYHFRVRDIRVSK